MMSCSRILGLGYLDNERKREGGYYGTSAEQVARNKASFSREKHRFFLNLGKRRGNVDTLSSNIAIQGGH